MFWFFALWCGSQHYTVCTTFIMTQLSYCCWPYQPIINLSLTFLSCRAFFNWCTFHFKWCRKVLVLWRAKYRDFYWVTCIVPVKVSSVYTHYSVYKFGFFISYGGFDDVSGHVKLLQHISKGQLLDDCSKLTRHFLKWGKTKSTSNDLWGVNSQLTPAVEVEWKGSMVQYKLLRLHA